MALTAMEAPVITRESKYSRTDEEVAEAIDALRNGQTPGESGYDKEGQARTAADRLINQIRQVDSAFADTLGSKAWETAENGWAFLVKIGKREAKDESKAEGKGSKKS